MLAKRAGKFLLLRSPLGLQFFCASSSATAAIGTEPVGAKGTNGRQRVAVIGVGWGGYSFERDLDKQKHELSVVSPRNHFTFTPLLPSTTTGTLEFRCIQEPVRTVKGLRYFQAEVTSIDMMGKRLHCREAFKHEPFELEYDKLIIAAGARTNTFGVPGVSEENHVFFLKSLSDARAIRNRLIECFERSSNPFLSKAERKRLLTFIVVGGGPTSVEFTAELHDFLKEDVRKWYPDLYEHVTVMLVESGTHILGAFDEKLVSYTTRLFLTRNVQIRTGTSVKAIAPGHTAELSDGGRVPFGLCVWSTGLRPIPLVESLPVEKDRGRIVVDARLRVPGCPGVYAIGDCAAEKGAALAPLAQVAQQQGRYLARCFNEGQKWDDEEVRNRPFIFTNLGKMAQVGEWRGVVDLTDVGKQGKQRHYGFLEGFLAFVTWRSAYWTKTVSWSNKLLIPMFWFKSWLFGRDISRF